MVNITKSLMSFSWAESLFAFQQFLNLLGPRRPDQSGGRTAAAFNALAGAAGGQLGEVMQGVYQVGNLLQQGTIDWMFDLLSGKNLSLGVALRTTSAVVRQAQDALGFLASRADIGLAWQEFKDKLQVFFWVRDVPSLLQLPPEGTYVPLTDLVARAYALDPFPALWAVEGAGHYYADSFWGRGEDPQGLLTDARTSAVPEKSLTMLHAGLGLSFAQHLLEDINPQSPSSEIWSVLRRFIRLCRENSRPGYIGAAFESLGLVARVFHPQELVPVLDRHLALIDEEVLAYFWHGVGRAIYFSPTYFLPFGRSPWRAVEMVHGEVPHELGRLNAMAGLTWAVTLVNMRRPQVLEAVVNAHGAEFARDGAFANGISSSLIMRYDTTPDASFIAAFCGHRPNVAPAVAAWDRLVRRPCEDALSKYYGVIKSRQCLGQVFRYQRLDQLTEQLRVDAAMATDDRVWSCAGRGATAGRDPVAFPPSDRAQDSQGRLVRHA
jgi:hypothetical protein